MSYHTGCSGADISGNVINVQTPLLRLTSLLCREEIFPRLLTFRPDMIFISAGFDAHKKDTINGGYIALVRPFRSSYCVAHSLACAGGGGLRLGDGQPRAHRQHLLRRARRLGPRRRLPARRRVLFSLRQERQGARGVPGSRRCVSQPAVLARGGGRRDGGGAGGELAAVCLLTED